MFKHYGLTGKTVKLRRVPIGDTPENPWAYAEQNVKVKAEYPNFLLVVILPHKNIQGYGLSFPYKTCIHKNDIQIGDVLLNGGAIK
ncbi:MAG: hypothetical protein LIO62_06075 [Clostridiales bacterium]|nr:hypothetical protein [Clostridiales bacterium]